VFAWHGHTPPPVVGAQVRIAYLPVAILMPAHSAHSSTNQLLTGLDHINNTNKSYYFYLVHIQFIIFAFLKSNI